MKLLLSILIMSTILFGSKADFIDDYDKAIELAQAEKKDIYMLVTSQDCQWCRKFERVTLSDKKTMQVLKEKYILLALNRDIDDIPAQYIAKRVPKHFFLTAKGEIIYTFLGYWNSEDFISFAHEVQKKK